MKKNILFTGGTGFIGNNVIPRLSKSHIVFAPSRSELDLTDSGAISDYIMNNNIDIIIHCANPNPAKNSLDKTEEMIRKSLELFLSIYKCKDLVEKIIYVGSGAVYDKTKDIVLVSEEEAFGSFPIDDYGFAKYVINNMTHGNIYNLCVFGCYGPGDADYKFITHCIHCCINKKPITIRQNCFFDYMQVSDLAEIMIWMIESMPRYNMYNACTGTRISLLEIAQIVKQKMDSDSDIIVLNEGLNYEYTGSNKRLKEEYTKEFMDIYKGIDIQIEWELKNYRGFVCP